MTAKEVIDCLRNRFCGMGWIFQIEFQLSHFSSRRADAVALQTGWSTGVPEKFLHTFVGFEVKISRADFLSEIKNPEKTAQTYVGTDLVFFATPKGLLDSKEVPDQYGLIECCSDGESKYTKIKRWPIGYVSMLEKITDFEDGVKVINADRLPPIERHVAVGLIRSFNTAKINRAMLFKLQKLTNDISEKNYKISRLEAELKAKEAQ